MTILIRPARPGDAERIAALLRQLGYPTSGEEVGGRLDVWAGEAMGALLVAELNGTVAGVAALHAFPLLEYSSRRGRLVALVVDETARGRGVGTGLVRKVEETARALGCRDLEVTSARERTVAHSFYAEMGYQDVCRDTARFLKPL